MDDTYYVEQQYGDKWERWSDRLDFFRAQTIARLARKQGRTVRVVDAFGNVL